MKIEFVFGNLCTVILHTLSRWNAMKKVGVDAKWIYENVKFDVGKEGTEITLAEYTKTIKL